MIREKSDTSELILTHGCNISWRKMQFYGAILFNSITNCTHSITTKECLFKLTVTGYFLRDRKIISSIKLKCEH